MGTRPLGYLIHDHRFTTEVPGDEVAHHISHLATLLSSALAQQLTPDAEDRLAAALADLKALTPASPSALSASRRGDDGS